LDTKNRKLNWHILNHFNIVGSRAKQNFKSFERGIELLSFLNLLQQLDNLERFSKPKSRIEISKFYEPKCQSQVPLALEEFVEIKFTTDLPERANWPNKQ